MQHRKSNSAHYNKYNSQYGNGWLLHKGRQEVKLNKTTILIYSEQLYLCKNLEELKMVQKFGKEQKQETEEKKLIIRYLSNHFQQENKNIQNLHKELMLIIYLQNIYYARRQLNQSKFELIEKFYPRDAKFTKGFFGNTYKFNVVNTNVAFSKTHKGLDEY